MKLVSKKIRKLFLIVMGMVTGIVLCGSIVLQVNGKTAENSKSKKVEIKAAFGLNGVVREGKTVQVSIQVTNLSNDIPSGKLQLIVPIGESESENALYEKPISIASGESKEILFFIPIYSELGTIRIRLYNEKDKKLADERFDVILTENPYVSFIGVLEDKKDALGYLTIDSDEVIYLDQSNMPENSTALEMLDLFIINNFDTASFTQAQYEAVKEWVKEGGILVIGTGQNASRTLASFTDDWLIGKTGKTAEREIDFGNGVKIKKEVVPITLKNSSVILEKEGFPLIQKVNYGLGGVLVASFDLELDTNTWYEAGTDLLEIWKSDIRQYEGLTFQYDSGMSNYGLFAALDQAFSNKIPQVGKYVIVIVIYVIIIGPVLYLLLKKLDKRHLMWILVPTSSLLCAGIIYLLGADTRISEPYLGYFNIVIAGENGYGYKSTYMGLTVPFNLKYHIDIDKQYDVRPIYSYEWTGGRNQLEKYKVAFQENGKQNRIQVNNLPAFSSLYLKSKEEVQIDGGWDSTLSFFDYQITGTFTNHLSQPLNKAILFNQDIIMDIGTIEEGETIQLSKKQVNFFDESMPYLTDIEMIEDMTGNNTWEIQEYSALQYCLNSFRERTKFIKDRAYLVAFTDSFSEKNILDQIDLDQQGTNLIIFPLDINRQIGNQIFIPSLDEYCEIIEEEEDSSSPDFVEIPEEDSSSYQKIIYQFQPQDQIISISYRKNANFDDYMEQNFMGKIYFFNYKTQKYDLIFDYEEGKTVTELKPYLNEKNQLIVLKEVEIEDDMYLTLPLSAIKEVK